jgi:pyridoxamine 5'-phosphate oxidase
MPPDWGGFIVQPEFFEFWQGRPGRLHDRFIYEKDMETGWRISRLAP